MIVKREKFEYQHKVLIERLLIKPPFKLEAIFQNEGCFLYIKGADTKFLSAEDNVLLNEKQAVLLNCGIYFAEWMNTTTHDHIEVIAIHLYPALLKNLYKNELPKTLLEKSKGNQIKRIIPDNTISKFIDSLNFYFENPNLVNDDLLELKIKELILLLVQTKNAPSILEIISGLYSSNTTNLKKVIDLHVFENLTISELAKLCHLSPSSFKREFKAIFNDSPTNYINRKKIEKAKELLLLSNMTIAAVSFEVGIADPQYFSRLFKKIAGETPSSYRNTIWTENPKN